ncbi:MAG: excinuclease ABC subunit UvrC [Chloroflexi bacterium]|nr:excinuclease ABC subunit UvrC [Chloroflexota bacterium]
MTTDAADQTAPTSPEDARAQLQAQVSALPARPGVYTFRDANDRVIYIGKAANLKSRVRSYFGSPRSLEGKTRVLARRIAALEYVTTHTEQDALHLEATLVKRHQPFFNVRLKDDKHYPYLKIDVDAPWPRVTITRRVAKDGSRYFGPYASAKSVRTTLDLVKKLFPWRSCDKVITGSDPRPCLEYYIRRCIAPCTSFCTPDEYREVIDQTMLFLEGKSETVVKQLKTAMTDAAEELNFERAAQLRDQISAVEQVTETQLTAATAAAEIDVFGLAVDGDEAVVQVLFIRGQKMAGSDHFTLAGVKEETTGSVIASFLRQHYESGLQPPKLVLIPSEIGDLELVQDWLTEKRGTRVEVRHPRRGDKRRLVEMATENASETLAMSRVRWLADRGRTDAALTELEEALSLPAPPNRIECYDISNTQGSNVVASMVVFIEGRPATSEYRRFRIKTVDTSEGPNDFASMAEVIQRRFKRLGEERRAERAQGYVVPDEPQVATGPEDEQSESEGWGAIPDLVIVDGGKGQVSATHDVMRNLAVDDIPLAGLAKREELLYLVDSSDPVRLDRRSQGLYLVQRIRDEAHRFAISYHRRLRARQTSQSTLDRIKGIGPRRKKSLLKKFGSLQAMREAEVNDLAATPGMTRRLAEQLKAEL